MANTSVTEIFIQKIIPNYTQEQGITIILNCYDVEIIYAKFISTI